MVIHWRVLLVVMPLSCACDVLQGVLRSLHDQWELEEITIVYQYTPKLPGWAHVAMPRIPNTRATGVDVSFLDLSDADLLNHVQVKIYPKPITAFLALPLDLMEEELQQMLHPETGHMYHMYDRFEIVIPVADMEHASPLIEVLYVPINCQVYFLVIPPLWNLSEPLSLYETYHIPTYRPENLPLALTVTLVPRGHHVPMTHEALWERRGNLQGVTLRASALSINQSKGALASHSPSLELQGYVPDLWHLLEMRLNFTTIYEPVADETWGGLSDDGHWTGLMGMLQRRDVDVAVAGMSITNNRTKVVDFTNVAFKQRYHLYFRKYSRSLSLESMSLMTPWQILVVLFASVSVTTVAQLVALRYSPEARDASYVGLTPDVVFFYNFYAFCQQGTAWGQSLQSSPGRLSLWLLYFCGLVVFNTYSATMISRLAVTSGNLPYQSMEELVRSNKYLLVAQSGTADVDVLQTVLQNLSLNSSKVMSELLPSTKREGIELVCKGNYAFWTTYNMDTYSIPTAHFSCNPVVLHTPYIDSLSIATVKGLPYTNLFNIYLQRLMEGGSMQSIKNKWQPMRFTREDLPESISLHHAVPLFVWIVTAFLVSLALLMAEIYVAGRNRARRLRREQRIKKNITTKVTKQCT